MPEVTRTVELEITPSDYFASISLYALLETLNIHIGEALVVRQRTRNGYIIEMKYYRTGRTTFESDLLPLRKSA